MKSSRTMATLSSIAFALLFSAILSVTVVAQSENGSISGTVKDSAGAVVSGAAVSLSVVSVWFALTFITTETQRGH